MGKLDQITIYLHCLIPPEGGSQFHCPVFQALRLLLKLLADLRNSSALFCCPLFWYKITAFVGETLNGNCLLRETADASEADR